jgi:hypothetical protein
LCSIVSSRLICLRSFLMNLTTMTIGPYLLAPYCNINNFVTSNKSTNMQHFKNLKKKIKTLQHLKETCVL